MIVHDFRCKKCKYEFEEWMSASDEIVQCAKCGSDKVERIYKSAPRIDKAKDPYDYLHGKIPDMKKIQGAVPKNYKGKG